MFYIFALVSIVLYFATFKGKPYDALSAKEKKIRTFLGYTFFVMFVLMIGSCIYSLPPDRNIDEKPDGAYTF